ncbi:MAG: ankyrin repeat domain-containing protein [Bacteroidota bacterium]|nr:ankyrin repeat domain-containing protein [Bacteroidota bacterium]MDP4246288.1 ankyrin repeat domain-containing protein [Bacteroidota bacterium]MDP4253248.1 ankyrin repeat domain-containing protein [Bacteroidota bacterium]MDP4259891.1 ankyrin repeat domain-containing protein [Bacteroidota bacterium]
MRILSALLLAIAVPVFMGSGPRSTDKSPGNKTLFEVIRSGSSDALEAILAKGADANDTLDGYSALMAAALNGSSDQMKILINHGAKVDYADAGGLTALWFSVPDPDKMKLLLERGANPQLPSAEKYTVLTKLAGIPGTVGQCQLLIDHGADPKKSGPDNMLLYNAASSCDTAVLGLLLRFGLNANDTISSGDYPINAALNYHCFSSVKMLVEHGANVNVRPMSFTLDPMNGITPLMFAAGDGDRPCFYYLLDHGADPNLRSKNGYTALMYLEQSERDEPEMTLALIKHGASASYRKPDGDDALALAKKKGNTKSAEILRKYMSQ